MNQRNVRFTREEPVSDRGDGFVLALAVLVVVVVLLVANVAI